MSGSQFYTVELTGWMGLDTRTNVSDKDPHYVEDCQNVDFEQGGVIAKRRGTRSVLSDTTSGRVNLLYDFQSQQGFSTITDSQRVLVGRNTQLNVYEVGMSTISTTFAMTNSLHYAISSDNGVCYITNENADPPKMLGYANSAFFLVPVQMVTPSTFAVVHEVVGPGGDLVPVYTHVHYTWQDIYGNESNPYAFSASTFRVTAGAIYVAPSELPALPEASVAQVNLYARNGTYSTEYNYFGSATLTGTYAATTTQIIASDAATLYAGTVLHDNYDAVPNGKYATFFASSLVLAGDPVLADLVKLSYPGFHRQWDINSFARATSEDAQPIKGLTKYLDNIMIGKSDSMSIGTGTTDTNFKIRTHDNDYGILGKSSMISAMKRYFMFYQDGIYIGYGNVLEEVSEKIRQTILRLNKAALNSNPSQQFSENQKFGKRLFFSVREATGAGENDTILVWDYGNNGSWTQYKGIQAVYMANIMGADKGKYLYGGDSKGNVYLFTVTGMNTIENSDNHDGANTAISSYVETPWIHLPKTAGMPNWARTLTEAAWLQLYAGGEGSGTSSQITLTTNVYTDFSSTIKGTYSTTHNAAAYPAVTCDPKVISGFAGTSDVFEVIKFRFSNNLAGEHYKIHKLIFGFRARPSVEK